MIDIIQKEVKMLTTQIFLAKIVTTIPTRDMRSLHQFGSLARVLSVITRYKIDIFGLYEMRWTNSGLMKSEHFILFVI